MTGLRPGSSLSPASIAPVEFTEIGGHTLLYSLKFCGVTDCPQRAQICFRETLIGVSKTNRKVDVTNSTSAAVGYDGTGDVIERLARARADIEDAGLATIFQKPKIDISNVAHKNEVTSLLAVTIGLTALK